MDYRYETNDDARDFHKLRVAFIILNEEIEFLPKGSSMSHFEYCKLKGMTKDEFNNLIRGYYLNGNVVFYKDNFTYDDNLICKALKFLDIISKELFINEFNIYFGELPDQGFKLDYYYGKYINGNIERI